MNGPEAVAGAAVVKKTAVTAEECGGEGGGCDGEEEETCQPLKTFEDLMKYGSIAKKDVEVEENVGDTLLTSPKSIIGNLGGSNNNNNKRIIKTVPRNRNFGDVKVTLDGRRWKSSECPKTLVCHDFKGGYGDDRFTKGTANPENYVFYQWLQTDIFVYFSHHFVTIPPVMWINAAHSHGVKVLGTIITEWDDGIKICDEILKDSGTIDGVVQKLVLIVQDFGFEGYLVNIENKLKDRDVPYMIEFLSKLTKSLKNISESNLVIWYDSVTIEGKLIWQDSLNNLNKPFFDSCDGIYLNYNWNDEKLELSRRIAGSRKFDVYVGVDVFGRGCFGGGGVNTWQAVQKIHTCNLSTAIFAPGWSFECHPYESYPKTDDDLWMPCAKYFFYRCLRHEFNQSNDLELLSPSPESNGKRIQVHFSTDFCRGCGTSSFCFRNNPAKKPWFNLSCQSFQPVLYTDPENRKIQYDPTKGFSGGGSLKLRKRGVNENPMTCSPVWFPLDIPIISTRVSIAVLAIWQSVSLEDKLQIFLEVSQPDNKSKKILLGSLDHLAASVVGKFYIHLKLSHFLRDHPQSVRSKSKDIDFFFRKNNYDETTVDGWTISCFLFDIDQTRNKYTGINGLKIGAEGDVSLGFLSLAQIIHYSDC